MGNSSSGPKKLGSKSTTEDACLGADLSDQLAIVTGCSAGIGIATVTQLVKQGCTVVMANRNPDKSQKAKDQVLINLGLKKAEVAAATTITTTKDKSAETQNSTEAEKKTEKEKKKEKDTENTDSTSDKNENNNNNDNNNNNCNEKENEKGQNKDETTENKNGKNDQNDEMKEENKSNDNTSATNDDHNDKLILLTLDLSSLESVYKFVESFIALKLEKRLTLIVNNAGIMALPEFSTSKEGYEMQFATNVLGHHYMTFLLLNHFKNNLRIVNLSSNAHSQCPKNLQDIINNGIKNQDGPSKDSYGAWNNYGLSKAGNILFTRELVERYANDGNKNNIFAYSVHPGVIQTELSRNMPGIQQKIFGTIGKFITKTIPQGAATTIYCCCQDNSKLVNGEFYQDCNEGFQKKLDKRFRKGAKGLREIESSFWDWCELLIIKKGFQLYMDGDDEYISKMAKNLEDNNDKKENDNDSKDNKDNKDNKDSKGDDEAAAAAGGASEDNNDGDNNNKDVKKEENVDGDNSNNGGGGDDADDADADADGGAAAEVEAEAAAGAGDGDNAPNNEEN